MAETTLPCPVCHEDFPVKLTFGEFEGAGFPVSLRNADLAAAWLEHAFAQGGSHA